MTGLLGNCLSGIFAAGKSIVSATGIKRTRFGRKILVGVNMGGAWLTTVLLSRRGYLEVGGHKMRVAGQRGPSPSFGVDMLLGRYETEVSKCLQQVLKPGMTALDIGAHVGFYTLILARIVGPEGRVYAFEPEPENFAVLKENVAANGYSNVRLINKAVADRCQKLCFFVSAEGNDRHSIFPSRRAPLSGSPIEVDAVSIDDVLEAEGWPRVDFVKMDVEGAEPAAISGMRNLVARSKHLTLIVEFAPDLLQSAGISGEEFLTNLSHAGFSIGVIEEDGSCRRLDRTHYSEVAQDARQRGAINLLCQLTSAEVEPRTVLEPERGMPARSAL